MRYNVFTFKMLDFRLKLRIIWVIALLAVVFWLGWQYVVPSGQAVYVKDFKHYNDFVGNLTPADRLSGQKIVGNPVYFSLRVPRRFESAQLTVKFKNPDNLPVIEAGVLKDKRVWQYDLRPLENVAIDNLLKSWSVLWEDDIMLLQREKKYGSLKDFLAQPPLVSDIAVYNYDYRPDFILSDYQPAREARTICRPLLGAYQFYTYIKNEDLSFDFSFQDLNKNNDSDPVDILVYYQDQQIAEEKLADDGSMDRSLKLFLADMPEGAYKVSVRANNDIVTRTIATKQSKIAFINRLNLASAPEVSCGRNFVTDSRKIQATTMLASSLGQVKIHQLIGSAFSEILDINETYRQFETSQNLPTLSEVIAPSDGISFSGDGLFAFSEEEFFNPQIKKVDRNFSPEGVNYVLARYAPPIKNDDWLLAMANFDLTNAYKEKGKHSLMISIPGLKADDSIEDGVEIGEIRFELKGTSLLEKIKKMVNGE